MAAFTSKATGNWSASGQTTWNETGVPGDGDTVTIAAGHVITVDDTRTVGTAGAEGTIAVQLNASGATRGQLLIAQAGLLICRGDCYVNGGHLNITGNGIFRFDSSTASSPSTTGYKIYADDIDSEDWITLAGTNNANRATITSETASSAKRGAIIRTAFAWTGARFSASWARFSQLLTIDLPNCVAGWTATDVVFEATVGPLVVGRVWKDLDHKFVRTQWLSTSTVLLDLHLGGNPTGAGTRVMQDAAFVGLVDFRSPYWEITNTVFYGDVARGNTNAGVLSWNNVFLRKAGGANSALPPTAAYNNTFAFYDNPSATNAHWWYVGTGDYQPTNILFHRWVLQGDVNGGEGDMLWTPATGVTRFTECVTLPNFDGTQGGCFLNVGVVAASGVEVEHCTFMTADTQTGVAVAETGDTPVGGIASLRSNIAYRTSAGRGALFHRVGGTRTDIATPATTGYNGRVNVTNHLSSATETAHLGYNAWANSDAMFSTAPSAATTDVAVTGAPFVDWTRDVRTYAVLRGLASGGDSNAAKKTALYDALLAIPNPADANYNAAVTIADLLAWVRAGFAPTNVALQAAHDGVAGGWIGAMAGVAGPGGVAHPFVNADPLTSLVTGGLVS